MDEAVKGGGGEGGRRRLDGGKRGGDWGGGRKGGEAVIVENVGGVRARARRKVLEVGKWVWVFVSLWR